MQRLTLLMNQEVRIDIPLLSGQQSEVVVTAPAPLLKTETASLGALITNHQIATCRWMAAIFSS